MRTHCAQSPVPPTALRSWYYHRPTFRMRKLRPQEGTRLARVTEPSQTEPKKAWVGAGRADVQRAPSLCPASQGDPVCSRHVRRRGGSGPQTQLVGARPAGEGPGLARSMEGRGPPASRTERILDRGGGRHLCTSDPFSSGAREARAGERLSQHTWPAHLASALSASVSPVVAS